MRSQFKKILERPIILLITVNILIGLFIFRDFGLTWDEPYFYSYGDALGYAYSPKEWFSGNFDLYNSYGASGGDHRNRGPAYLFLARNFVYGVETLGSDSASAWHLVNYLFFQLGIYFIYRISKRWMSKPAAFFASAFFAFQPLLWGHAFINPKDPPFLTFFLAALCFGFEMVDALSQNTKGKTKRVLVASFFLGIATSIRVIGPLAGLLVFVYFLSKRNLIRDSSTWRSFILYGFTALAIMFATWPYLWDDPLQNFIGVFHFMSDNPTHLGVLFGGKVYNAGELPRRYLPFMLVTTLTEPTWILFSIGFIHGYWTLMRNRHANREAYRSKIVSLSLAFSPALILVAYALLRKPAMYDGIRHFLFILPSIYIFIGFGFQFILEKIKSLKAPGWLSVGIGILLLLPGPIGNIKLHPYEYTYYNSFVGGTDGVFRKYETEYWLTCYKDAMEQLKGTIESPINLFVFREPYVARYYTNEDISVYDLRRQRNMMQQGDYMLISTRTNEDEELYQYEDAPILLEVKKNNSVFCVVKQNQ